MHWDDTICVEQVYLGQQRAFPQLAHNSGCLEYRCILHVAVVWRDSVIDTGTPRGGQIDNQPPLARLVWLGYEAHGADLAEPCQVWRERAEDSPSGYLVSEMFGHEVRVLLHRGRLPVLAALIMQDR